MADAASYVPLPVFYGRLAERYDNVPSYHMVWVALVGRRLLALQLRLAKISGLLRRHGSEVTDGGRRDRGCAGAVGRLAAGGEAADPAALHPGAGRGLGGAVPGRPARAGA